MRFIGLGFATLVSVIACNAEVGSDSNGESGGTTGSGGSSAGGTTSGGSANGSGGASGATAGGSVGAGGSGTGGSATGGSSAGGSGGSAPLPSTLRERIKKTTVTVSAGVKAGVQNWRIWGRGNLRVAPVFTVPLPSCETLVCYTSGNASSPTAHVVRLNADDTLAAELVSEPGVECRGLAAGEGGQFAALLWDDDQDDIAVHRYDASGTALGATPLVNNDNDPTDFGIGESRLEYGDGRYGAYYHVHSNSGHEGDTLKWVDAQTGAEDTEWGWGCSHSMSNLLRYNPALSEFIPACVTDCYPGTKNSDFATSSIGGIYLNHDDEKVMDVAAGCNGDVAGELGGAAPSPNGWKLVFNAHQAPTTLGQNSYDEGSMNQDIGFSSISGTYTASSVVWLTNTNDIDEADASIAPYQPPGAGEQYLVGWTENDGDAYKLTLIDGSGAFVESVIDVTADVQWGRRDDPFRQAADGDVIWAWFDSAGSTTLNIARVESGVSYQCQ